MRNWKLSVQRLREVVSYDSTTGLFTWNLFRGSRAPAGAVAGSPDSHGYIRIMIDREHIQAHRLAWLYVYGEWPMPHVDHLDHDTANNRISNLREATRFVNGQNRFRANRNNSAGLLGAHAKRNKWSSSIVANGKIIPLGVFVSPEEAHAAYLAAKRKHHEGCLI